MPKSHTQDEPTVSNLGDNCIQNLHLRRYIVRYTCKVGNLILQEHMCGTITCKFGLYIRHFIPK